MEKKTITIDNKLISYKTEGAGLPVVLLHGFGEDGTVWENQAAYLRRNYQVIIPDIPGSGDSELTADVSMEGIADTVQLILDEEELDSVVLIGHSMGGYATMAFVEKYPHLLDGFGLFHSTAAADTEAKKKPGGKALPLSKKTAPGLFWKQRYRISFPIQQKNKIPD